jgi:hypothetical protein
MTEVRYEVTYDSKYGLETNLFDSLAETQARVVEQLEDELDAADWNGRPLSDITGREAVIRLVSREDFPVPFRAVYGDPREGERVTLEVGMVPA